MRLIMKPGQDHPVFGKMVRAGEEFEVPDLEAPVWIHSGRASEVQVHRNHSVATKVMKAAAEESHLEEKQDKKRYARRDMRPEE